MLPGRVVALGGHRVIELGDQSPALLGRWGTYETVGDSLMEKADGSGEILFDLRRTTYPATDEEMAPLPRGTTKRPVSVGKYPGEATFWDDQYVASLYWHTDTHSYRLVVSGVGLPGA